MKKILVLILFFVGVLFVSKSAIAVDFNISCTETTCTPATVTGFFPATEIWYPTKIFSQSIQLYDNSGQSQKISAEPINFTQNQEEEVWADLAKVIQYTITRQSDNVVVWTGSLYSFYHSGGVELINKLSSHTSETFIFKGEMYETAGDEFQDRRTQFDLVITVITDEPPSPPPCNITPAPVPGPLSLDPNGSGKQVKVTWGVVSGATGYEVSWGTNKEATDKGTQSVGTTYFTHVDGLDLDNYRYYFKVRSVKDCAKSDWNGIKSTGNGPDLLSVSTGQTLGASTFVPQEYTNYIGANELPSPIPSLKITRPSKNNVSSVLGTATENTCNYIWWQILLAEALVASLYMKKYKNDLNEKKHRAAIILGILLTFIGFSLINKCLTYSFVFFANSPSLFGKYFIVLDALVMLVLRFILFRPTVQIESTPPTSSL